MNSKHKMMIGSVTLLYNAAAFAQGTSGAAGAASSASAPPGDPNGTAIPTDPAWFVAGLAVGLVVGYVVAKVTGSSNGNAKKRAALN